MKWTVLPIVLVAVGFVLMGTSLLWPMVIGKESVWNEGQAKELQRAGTSLHHLHHEYQVASEPGGSPPPGHGHSHAIAKSPEELAELKAEYEKAIQDFERSRADLEAARNWRSVPVIVFRWLAIAAMALGVSVHYVLRTEWGQQFVNE